MTKITTLMTEMGYQLSKEVYENKKTKNIALDELEQNYGMSRGSAIDYIHGFKSMMSGRIYKRTFNAEATDLFLENIYYDYGAKFFSLALQSVAKHMSYYNGLKRGNLNSVERIYKKHMMKYKNLNNILMNGDELDERTEYIEGLKKTILVNAYERNYEAREECIRYYGSNCIVCDFNFEKTYGDIGRGFIHVHHLKAISSIGLECKINPIKDLRPVCPNCHAMLHKRNPPLSIDELIEKLNRKNITK